MHIMVHFHLENRIEISTLFEQICAHVETNLCLLFVDMIDQRSVASSSFLLSLSLLSCNDYIWGGGFEVTVIFIFKLHVIFRFHFHFRHYLKQLNNNDDDASVDDRVVLIELVRLLLANDFSYVCLLQICLINIHQV